MLPRYKVVDDSAAGDQLNDHDQYLAMFKGHTESYRHVRVVFTGRDGAGKTTVCCRLQNKRVDLKSRIPTVGAVLHPHWFSIDWKFKIWEHITDQSPSEVIQTRMGIMMRNTQVIERDANLQAVSRGSSSAKRIKLEVSAVKKASRCVSSDVVFLSLWDMGGHTSFQATHNIFVSSHGIYLLVFRLTSFLRYPLETDRLKKWIRMIGTFSSVELNAPQRTTHVPPIIFVGTFLDELKKTPDCDKQVDAIRSSISKFPELSPHKFVKFCTVDNSLGNDDADLNKLRGFITDLAVHQDQWDRKLPTTWLKFEMDLLKSREDGNRILTLGEVVEMNKTSIAPLAGVDEIKLALEYLHCTRSVIYFREFDNVINDPQWLADFFSILITDDQFLPKDDLTLTRDLELYSTNGELTQKLIQGLLSLEKNIAFLPHESVLLALMEKFGLIVNMMISGTTAKHAQFSKTYTIPTKLMELQVEHINGVSDAVGGLQHRDRAVSNTLCYVFNAYIPDELFHRIFALILKTYRAVSLSTQSFREAAVVDQTTITNAICLYRGFGCFEVDDLCRMILSMHAERSTIAVTVISPTESKLPAECGQGIRLSIDKILRDTLQMSNHQHFQYTHQLHCNFHLSPYDTPVNLYGVIRAENGVPCKGSECQGQHRLSKTDIAFWDINEDSAKIQGSGDVTDVTEGDTNISNRRPTPRELGRLSRLVDGSCYELLFNELGLSHAQIEMTKRESSGLAGITLITKLFIKWTNEYPNQTLHHIELAMTGVDMAADRIVEVVETEEDSLGQDLVPNEVWSRAPSDAEIQKVVNNIGNTFYNLCLELGLSPPIIEQHEMGHPVTFQARMCALLRCWIERFQTKATIGRLLTAMKVCQMDWHTTAQIWSGR